jgi:hypothetical protein
MKAGEELELRGSNEVVVRVGDAGALLVGLNGQTRTVLGQTGAVVTKRFEAVPQNEVVRAADTPRPPSSFPNPRAPLSTDARSLRTQPVPASYQRTGRAASPKPLPQTGARGPGQMMAATGGNDEADVLRAHEAYFEALRRGDSGQMSRLAADGFTATGAPAADESGTPYEISVGQAAVDVRGLGAVVSGTASQRISSSDGQSTRNQMLMFSEVWVKRDGQWQLMNVRFVTPNGTR